MTNTKTLRVVEALQQDVSYGRCRVDGQVRTEMNISPGDIICIKGAKETSAVVWRSHPGDDGKGIIHIDNLIRKNAGVAVGDKVEISKIDVTPLNELVLEPAIGQEQEIQFGDGIETLAKRGLLKRPMHTDDIVIIPNIAMFGNALPFRVVSMASRQGAATWGLVNEETKVIVKGLGGKEVDQKPNVPPETTKDSSTVKLDAIRVAATMIDWSIRLAVERSQENKLEESEAYKEVAFLATAILKKLEEIKEM